MPYNENKQNQLAVIPFLPFWWTGQSGRKSASSAEEHRDTLAGAYLSCLQLKVGFLKSPPSANCDPVDCVTGDEELGPRYLRLLSTTVQSEKPSSRAGWAPRGWEGTKLSQHHLHIRRSVCFLSQASRLSSTAHVWPCCRWGLSCQLVEKAVTRSSSQCSDRLRGMA